jgi:putative SOS response-associated peptidase YedK
MCGRYTITRQQGLADELEAALDPSVEHNRWWKPRFNVAPTQDAPVVTLRDGVRTLEMMRWGLVPFWAGKDGARPPLARSGSAGPRSTPVGSAQVIINARVETVKQKPMFRDPLARGRRCLVPADGFFEWKKQGKHKQPMWIHPGDGRTFAFAGLWSRAKIAGAGGPRGVPGGNDVSDTGELRSFAIVTGPPNELVESIHDRMPIVIARDAWAAWLDPALDTDAAIALLTVPPVDDWVAEPVSTRVNVADHDDEGCVAPMTAPVQGSLF